MRDMLVTSALLAHTNDLDLIIRHVLAGLGHGIHAGRERGAGVEFSEYRSYAPGDEWRRVDWKLAARADRYYVREAERDSHVGIWLWLDASASMAEPSRHVEGLTKIQFARSVLACVAAIAQRQGDAFGLIVCRDQRMQYTPAARGPRQLHRIMDQLTKAEPGGTLPDETSLRSGLHFCRAPGVVFAVSDFLEWPSPMSDALVRLRRMQHDVRALCLQTRAERNAEFAQGTAFFDPESAAGTTRLHAFTPALRNGYLAQSQEHFAHVEASCKQHDITFINAEIEQAIHVILRAWLRQAGPRARL